MYGYDIFAYNKWANVQLFNACRNLSEEQLDFHLPGASGPVRELLVHLVGGQQSQILRAQGRQHEDELTRQSEWPGMDMLHRDLHTVLFSLALSALIQLFLAPVTIALLLPVRRTREISWARRGLGHLGRPGRPGCRGSHGREVN